jgi:hypothetical protein
MPAAHAPGTKTIDRSCLSVMAELRRKMNATKVSQSFGWLSRNSLPAGHDFDMLGLCETS